MVCFVKIRAVGGSALSHLLRHCLGKYQRTHVLSYPWLKFSWQKDARYIFKWQFVYLLFGWPGAWGQRHFCTSNKHLYLAPRSPKWRGGCVFNTFLFFFSWQAVAFAFSHKLVLNPLCFFHPCYFFLLAHLAGFLPWTVKCQTLERQLLMMSSVMEGGGVN